MKFELTIDRDRIAELEKERAIYIQELECAEQNVKRLKRGLAQCDEKIISLARQTNTNYYGDMRMALRLASEETTQDLTSMVLTLVNRKWELEASLPTLSPEQVRRAEIEINVCTERIEIYRQVFVTRVGISW
jgi:ribosomal protein L37AE/L43A